MPEQPGLLDLLSYWRHEGLTPLASIRGYAELFLKGGFGLLTAEQRQAMQVIYRSSLQAAHRWHYPTDYLRLAEGEEQFAACPLGEVVAAAVDALQRSLSIGGDAQVTLAPNLPAVRASAGLITALAILLAPEESESFPMLQAGLAEDGTVHVQIQARLSKPEGDDILSAMAVAGTRLYLAQAIVRQHGGEISARHADQVATFEFSLLSM